MLQMKKNTAAKVATLVASVASAVSIYGLVQQNAPAAAASSPPLVQASSTNSTSSTSAQTKSTTTTSNPKVTTRTRAS